MFEVRCYLIRPQIIFDWKVLCYLVINMRLVVLCNYYSIVKMWILVMLFKFLASHGFNCAADENCFNQFTNWKNLNHKGFILRVRFRKMLLLLPTVGCCCNFIQIKVFHQRKLCCSVICKVVFIKEYMWPTLTSLLKNHN